MDRIAESFVKLALAVGEHDPLYVDAYFGPEAWARAGEEGKEAARRYQECRRPAHRGAGRAGREPGRGAAPAAAHVSDQAARNARGAREHAGRGKKLAFDEESNALYDACRTALRRDVSGRRSSDRLARAFRGRHAPRPARAVQEGSRRSEGPARRRFRGGDRRSSKETKEHIALPRERVLHRRIRNRRAVGRLQLVQGREPERDPDQHGLPRRISTPRSVSPATKDTRAITFRTFSWSRASCGTGAGPSSPFLRSPARSLRSMREPRIWESRSRSPATRGTRSSATSCIPSPASMRPRGDV